MSTFLLSEEIFSNMKIFEINNYKDKFTSNLSFYFTLVAMLFAFNIHVYAIRYNAGFEIVKNCSVPNFANLNLQYSYDLAKWEPFHETEGLNLNCYYGGLKLYFDSEMVYLRFQKEVSKNIIVSGTITNVITTYLRSDIYSSSFDKKKTHFLVFETNGITNNSSKSELKSVAFTPGKPPKYHYFVTFHYETLTNSFENNHYPININRIIQISNHIQIDWSFPQQQPSPITYFVGIGFMSFGAFTNMPTTETSYTWMPPRTGKYWCMIRAEDSDSNSYFSEPVPFVYIDPNDSGEADSDNDGFNDIEELLRNSDPDDPLDVPIIICDTNANLEVSKDIYLCRELLTKRDVPAFWEYLGTLPEGISLSSDGMLSGVPKEIGIFDVEITANGLNGNHSDTTSYRITVVPAVPSSVKIGTGEIKVIENE